MSEKTAEQKARDMLDHMGIEDAQNFSAGDVVELANLLSEIERLRAVILESIELTENSLNTASRNAEDLMENMNDLNFLLKRSITTTGETK